MNLVKWLSNYGPTVMLSQLFPARNDYAVWANKNISDFCLINSLKC